jgi:uncharacterized repeat protein (TIGR04138 family)
MATGHEPIDWTTILETAGGYPMEAFEFVRDGLAYTVSRIHEQPESLPELSRHVSGQQLCLGLRDHALDRWGMMASTVLESWNIHRTDDFGRIVFAMIEHGVMSKTPQDSLADFRGVFDFDEAFAPSAVAATVRDRIPRD